MSLFALFYMLFAYLLGSISSAILICRLAGLSDPRNAGSHNPGATNVLRIGGRWAALAVLIFDVLKGMLPVWAGYYLGLTQFELGMVALGACLGHIFPIFFKFKGGKGVATAFGAIAPIGWGVDAWMFGTWLAVFLLTGYSSLSAVIAAITIPFYVWWYKPEFTFPVALVCCLLVYRHHDNIQRLWRGQEDKIWKKLKKKR
ncbi:glycerol-3-phosphate 1-O-acyltransferase PlsY [Avibacterium paragallinarum]|uniref:Glycerol-3-phosphate acyltransferase n=1 Tax=Avibacterium paragallinarum TaxID=728 RepID=A0A0F5F0M4_AVIPA|nr:glycerol-3-phosphate 1-O-acyltransferase PlsY [Avibacterium paragallinarum]KAA6208918.1 glycerol-3-phosphate 1-O-acyltransferase PlsY [Avibacterium paragallinarum]KKB02449.1 glycerol-3-phosphate acyltransferase [Avibacterium paragallinarum]MEE3607675.1 glycerol-3-phosphate 1-O-acyltransferase PlsY [Avibacterium paragallinarum]MEE3620439.1 glycerol-3-phosphate 1-O-acyltransferase PlsY [Avibacterium paragallinarum]MEE3668460.1 glycerol-3-phosphate 1-O-acyltransferase PlsY [Avibacterium paraga